MSSPLTSAFQVLAFNADAVHAIYSDKSVVRRELIGTAVASILAAVCLGAALALLGKWLPNLFSAFSPAGWFRVGAGVGLVLALLAFAVSIGATHLIAQWLGGSATIGEYHAAFVWTSVPLQIISLLALFTIFVPGAAVIQLLVALYTLAVQLFVVRVTYSLPWVRAAIALIVPLAILFVLFLILLTGLAAWGLVVGVETLKPLISGLF